MADHDHERQALAFLRDQLGSDAPTVLTHVATFRETPLEQEGDTSVYRFRASVGGAEPADYWVLAGRTQPNYYPDWTLTPEQAYEMHLGTRFMLVMDVASVPLDAVSPDDFRSVEAFIATAVPTGTLTHLAAAAAFRVEDQRHVVFRGSINGETVYILGAEGPPGIYREVHLPPHVIFRRHLGCLIRREKPEDSST